MNYFFVFFETAAAFLAGVTGVSILFGFGTTLAAAKKKDPHFFDRGLSGTFDDPQPATPSAPGASASGVRHGARRSMAAAESGASLALRALGWGTVYSVAGCSLLFYAIWKMMGAQNVNITWNISDRSCISGVSVGRIARGSGRLFTMKMRQLMDPCALKRT